MRDKFYPLETYRGFAALMIAAIHFDVNSPLVNHSLANGYFVQFFFTLSGFVIYLNYNNKLKNFKNLIYFIKKRFMRLYPVHLFFLIVFLFIEIAKYILENEYGLIANNVAFNKNDLFSFFANFFLLQTFLYDYTFNTPSWSISSEFITYVFFGLLIFRKLNIFFSVVLLIVILFFRFYETSNFGEPNKGYISLIDCIYGFCWGLVFCKIYLLNLKNGFFKKIANYLTFGLIILTLYSITNIKNQLLFILPLIFGALIFCSCYVSDNSILGKFISHKVGIFLGKISYSIYMSHLFIFWMVTQILRFVFKFETFVENQTGLIKLNLDVFQSNVIVICCYVLTILFSNFVYKNIEMRFYKKF